MASIPNTPIWADFFDTLKDLPELWKVKSEVFKDRNKKNKGWQSLLNIYKLIEPNANIDSLKKRLTNIKTCYRRELKKIEISQRCGAGADEEYVPSLWYFEALDFLRDQEVQLPGVSTMDLEELDEAEEACEIMPATVHSSQKRKKSVGQHMAERNDLLKEALGQLTKKEENNKDNATIYAESWAASFRNMSPIQQLYAKKAIEEILVLGQLDLLSLNSANNPTGNSTYTSSFASSASSTPIPVHHSPLSSSLYENAVVTSGHVQGDNIYRNVQQLLLDNDFS